MNDRERSAPLPLPFADETVHAQLPLFADDELTWEELDGCRVATFRGVGVGGPIGPAERRAAAMEALVERRRREGGPAPIFFGVEERAGERPLPLAALPIAEEPLFATDAFPAVLAGAASLRYQLARGRRAGVLVDVGANAEELAPIVAATEARRRMPPLGFLVRVAPARGPAVCLAARVAGRLVAAALLRVTPTGGRLLVEHLLRAPGSPNGATELLVAAAFTYAASLGIPELTLGLLPLTGPRTPAPLRLARTAGSPFYDFDGLARFKHKFRPARSASILLVHGATSPIAAVTRLLRAFAERPLHRFAARAAADFLSRGARRQAL